MFTIFECLRPGLHLAIFVREKKKKGGGIVVDGGGEAFDSYLVFLSQ